MIKLFSIIITNLIFQYTFSQTLDNAAIHRIGDYGKLWTVITLFHPDVAYNNLNVDSLFIDHITELLKDPSALNFKSTLQHMIDNLSDPYTIIEDNNKIVNDSVALPSYPLLKWFRNSTALLHLDLPFIMQNSSRAGNAAVLHLIDSLENAHNIIIDLREAMAVEDEFLKYVKVEFLKQLMSHFINRPIHYPAYRTRIHYGHESQTFDIPFYYQGWVLQNSPIINPNPPTIQKPVCLLINKYNNYISEDIAAFQNEGIAKVIADGTLTSFEPSRSYSMQLVDSIKVSIRLSEVIYANGSRKFAPDSTILRINSTPDTALFDTAISLLNNKREDKSRIISPMQNLFTSSKVAGYDSLAYPPAPLRLLALMRYWSAINYFCPNKSLITKNWDSVLYEYVPLFLSAKDSLQYALTAARLIKEINDGHGFFSSPVHEKLIANSPEIQLLYVENKTIVYKVFNDTLNERIAIGDEVMAIDDKPVKRYRDSIGQYIGASNEVALQQYITQRVLAGEANSFVKVLYIHNAKPQTIKLKRVGPWYQYYFTPSQQGEIWKKLNNKVGYVNLGRLETMQIDSMFQDLNNTEAIIIDNRSYPRGTVWSLISYLTDKPVRSAKGTTMIADSPDPLTVTVQESIWEIPVTPKKLYKGKIIVLVNETTQSQAEYSCMVLQAASRKVTIIGSQTAGADGDVTGILLPGRIQTGFSGHGIYYPDGRSTQGIGIVPHIKVKPTIKGIKAGRDEVLERAILFAKTGK